MGSKSAQQNILIVRIDKPNASVRQLC